MDHCSKYRDVNREPGFPALTICSDFSVPESDCAIDHKTMTYKRGYDEGEVYTLCNACVRKLLG